MNTSFLANELQRCWSTEKYSFHMPGHKSGASVHPLAIELIGQSAFRADVSEIGGFDYLHAPIGNMRKAQELAAQVFGAEYTYFLVNGSTVGNLASFIALVNERDKVLLSRSSHQSVFNGLILSGASPVYLPSLYHASLKGHFGIDVSLAEKLLQDNPTIRAIHLTRPDYYGMCLDLIPFVELAQKYKIPLVVDEAHGAHYVFSPLLPSSALSNGADIVIQSPHKTLNSLTQSSLLHLSSKLVDRFQLEQALRVTQSSSPSALLLLSLDITCAWLASEGQTLWERAVKLAEFARERVNQVKGICCYGTELVNYPGIAAYDPTKLIVDFSKLDMTGFQVASYLRSNYGIGVELADEYHIVCSVTLGDTEEKLELLIGALKAIAGSHVSLSNSHHDSSIYALPSIPNAILTPREAFQSPRKTTILQEAIGEISSEFIILYPPGVPILVPGETVDSDVIGYAIRMKEIGYSITGLADPTMATIQVVG